MPMMPLFYYSPCCRCPLFRCWCCFADAATMMLFRFFDYFSTMPDYAAYDWCCFSMIIFAMPLPMSADYFHSSVCWLSILCSMPQHCFAAPWWWVFLILFFLMLDDYFIYHFTFIMMPLFRWLMPLMPYSFDAVSCHAVDALLMSPFDYLRCSFILCLMPCPLIIDAALEPPLSYLRWFSSPDYFHCFRYWWWRCSIYFSMMFFFSLFRWWCWWLFRDVVRCLMFCRLMPPDWCWCLRYYYYYDVLLRLMSLRLFITDAVDYYHDVDDYFYFCLMPDDAIAWCRHDMLMIFCWYWLFQHADISLLFTLMIIATFSIRCRHAYAYFAIIRYHCHAIITALFRYDIRCRRFRFFISMMSPLPCWWLFALRHCLMPFDAIMFWCRCPPAFRDADACRLCYLRAITTLITPDDVHAVHFFFHVAMLIYYLLCRYFDAWCPMLLLMLPIWLFYFDDKFDYHAPAAFSTPFHDDAAHWCRCHFRHAFTPDYADDAYVIIIVDVVRLLFSLMIIDAWWFAMMTFFDAWCRSGWYADAMLMSFRDAMPDRLSLFSLSSDIISILLCWCRYRLLLWCRYYYYFMMRFDQFWLLIYVAIRRTPMRRHARYFSIYAADDALMPDYLLMLYFWYYSYDAIIWWALCRWWRFTLGRKSECFIGAGSRQRWGKRGRSDLRGACVDEAWGNDVS